MVHRDYVREIHIMSALEVCPAGLSFCLRNREVSREYFNYIYPVSFGIKFLQGLNNILPGACPRIRAEGSHRKTPMAVTSAVMISNCSCSRHVIHYLKWFQVFHASPECHLWEGDNGIADSDISCFREGRILAGYAGITQDPSDMLKAVATLVILAEYDTCKQSREPRIWATHTCHLAHFFAYFLIEWTLERHDAYLPAVGR